jgi:hypothetical protein
MQTTIWIRGMKRKKEKTITVYLLRRILTKTGEYWMTELVEDHKPKLITLAYEERLEEKLAKKKRYGDFIDVSISRGTITCIFGEHRDETYHPSIAIPKKSLIPYPLKDDDEVEGWVD